MKKEIIGLIAGSSGDMLAKELHRAEYRVAMICGAANEAGAGEADFLCVNDLENRKEILNFLQLHAVTHLVLGTGHIKAIMLAEFLKNNGIKTNLDIDAVILCKNKYMTNKKLSCAGIRVPKNMCLEKEGYKREYIQEYIKKIGLPCVLKSINDFQMPMLIGSSEELIAEIEKLFDNEESLMLEQYIKGSDFTVPVVFGKKNVKALKVVYWSKGDVYNLDGFSDSKSYYVGPVIEKEVLKIAESAIKAVNAKGLTRVDIIVGEDGTPYVLEINGVIMSGVRTTSIGLFYSAGINRPKLIISEALEEFGLKNYRSDIGAQFYRTSGSKEVTSSINMDYIEYSKLEKYDQKNIHKYAKDCLIEYLEAGEVNYSDKSRDAILSLQAAILLGNYDYIINNLNGEEGLILDLILKYYNISSS